jgi:hypothetical protein
MRAVLYFIEAGPHTSNIELIRVDTKIVQWDPITEKAPPSLPFEGNIGRTIPEWSLSDCRWLRNAGMI